VLLFLATRCLELIGSSAPEQRLEREMSERLIDLVLYRLHGLEVDASRRLDLSQLDEF